MPRSHGQSATNYRPWTTLARSPGRPDGDKTSKASAQYTNKGTEREHCSICQHFIPPHGQNRWARCTEVSGEIMPGGWCRFFRKK